MGVHKANFPLDNASLKVIRINCKSTRLQQTVGWIVRERQQPDPLELPPKSIMQPQLISKSCLILEPASRVILRILRTPIRNTTTVTPLHPLQPPVVVIIPLIIDF